MSSRIVPMEHFGFPELVVVMVVAVLLLSGMNLQEVARRVAESISNFRGGGPGPSHPIPANDSKILNRRNRKLSDNKPAN